MPVRPAHVRRIRSVLTVLLALVFPAHAQDSSHQSPWPAHARAAQRTLLDLYWNDQTQLYNISHPDRESEDPLMYWWQAHAIDVLIDGYERSQDRASLDRAETLWQSVKRHNRGPTNQYYDDMEWMALALLRLHAHAADESLRADIDALWADIKTGWNDEQGGGIAWRKTQRDYKNTPANAPAVILAARLYQLDHDPDDLAWARKIYDWLTDHLVDPDTGFVWDGVNRTGDGKTDRHWAFSYNQGVRIGAAVELYHATGDPDYLDDAKRTYASALERLADADGFFHEAGHGDKGLFKGIFFRYAGLWADANPDARPAVEALIARHARSLWEHAKGNDPLLFPSDWTMDETRSPADLSVQLSGTMLLEQMARLAEPGHQ